jgi:hypothetical protein
VLRSTSLSGTGLSGTGLSGTGLSGIGVACVMKLRYSSVSGESESERTWNGWIRSRLHEANRATGDGPRAAAQAVAYLWYTIYGIRRATKRRTGLGGTFHIRPRETTGRRYVAHPPRCNVQPTLPGCKQ